MRTRNSTITFQWPFILNSDAGELPAGSYEIEIDEEEIIAADRSGYCRTAVHLYVNSPGSMRMLAIEPAQLDAALERDAQARDRTDSSC